ncbi:MAG: hypothetical protein KGH72_04450 [Candidatus Micrarchaeota archaeon]|nr:hypothetical protein [Candidatus Micrarchaeota archaeon]
MEDIETLKKYNNIYIEIISRYKGYIEEQEGLSVASLPKLVTPEDESVGLVARGIKAKFPIYKPEDNFLSAARQAQEYVRKNITVISLPFQFWLKPAETIKYGAGDKFDIAVLLCSLLLALGSSTAKTVIVSRESGSRFYISFEWNGKFVLADIEKDITQFNTMDELKAHLGIEGDDVSAYEFNDKLYNDIA